MDLVSARNPSFSITAYGNLGPNLRVFNLRDVFQEHMYRVNREITVLASS
jgi:hypothetical protein